MDYGSRPIQSQTTAQNAVCAFFSVKNVRPLIESGTAQLSCSSALSSGYLGLLARNVVECLPNDRRITKIFYVVEQSQHASRMPRP